MIELIEKNGINVCSARNLHELLEVSSQFSTWISRGIENAWLIENIDFFITKNVKNADNQYYAGRNTNDYYLTRDAALSIIVMSRVKKAKKIRLEIINAFQKRQNLEYITPKEAALAYEYINCYKYIENQRKAYVMHQDSFVINNPPSKYIYSEFAKYRANIIGWDKSKVDEAIEKYLTTHAGHNFTKLMKLTMSDKLSIIDINEAIRVSILDLLFSKGTDPELANKFANMVKNVSKEMEILALRKNENNLFQVKESISLKTINQ